MKEKRRCKFWNAGYCKLKKACPFLHPENICSEIKCVDKTCKKRHPRTCKNWKKGSCQFCNLCEFSHEEKVNVDSDNEIKQDDTNIDKHEDSDYIDYDNLDSDDDKNIEKVKTTFSCDQCDYISHVKSSLSRHVNTAHDNSCDQCDFKTTNKMHLKMHKKTCHEKNLNTKARDTKKRKLTDEISQRSSGKKKKNNVISKKVKNVKC